MPPFEPYNVLKDKIHWDNARNAFIKGRDAKYEFGSSNGDYSECVYNTAKVFLDVKKNSDYMTHVKNGYGVVVDQPIKFCQFACFYIPLLMSSYGASSFNNLNFLVLNLDKKIGMNNKIIEHFERHFKSLLRKPGKFWKKDTLKDVLVIANKRYF